MKKNKQLIKLNIQMFAEGGEPNPTTPPTPKTYSEEEYKALLDKFNKEKEYKDKYASQIADYKNKEKEKLSEDEKLALEREEMAKELEGYKNEIRNSKISKELVTCGFDDKAVGELIDSISKGDLVEFSKELSKKVNALVENKTKQLQEELKKKTPIPTPSKSQNGNEVDDYVKNYLESRNRRLGVKTQN